MFDYAEHGMRNGEFSVRCTRRSYFILPFVFIVKDKALLAPTKIEMFPRRDDRSGPGDLDNGLVVSPRWRNDSLITLARSLLPHLLWEPIYVPQLTDTNSAFFESIFQPVKLLDFVNLRAHLHRCIQLYAFMNTSDLPGGVVVSLAAAMTMDQRKAGWALISPRSSWQLSCRELR